MNVTMGDVAAKLGLHPSTVSLALRDSPRIAKATRARVKETAVAMGYRVNPYLSALMRSRSQGADPGKPPVIALVTAGKTPDESTYGHNVREFIRGCNTVAEDLGIRTEHFWLGDATLTAERLNRMLCSRGIPGAVLLSSGRSRAKMDHPWHDLAIVRYGILERFPVYDWVQANHHGNMERLLAILRGEGLQRIGFAMDTPYGYDNLNPWLSIYVLEQWSLPPRKRLKPWLDPEPTFEGFQAWLDKEKPDAVVCVRPSKILGWLDQLGLRVPEDIGVATLGTAEVGGSISGIVENARTSSKLACEMLLDRIHKSQMGQQETPRHVTVSGQWNRGETIRYR